ncbi:MAG: polyphosphate kinase 1 [Tepidisphaeraceae bacterium]
MKSKSAKAIESEPTADAAASSPATLLAVPSGKLFFNRESSWLDFNRRVLELAQDTTFPLLERVKFLAIFASNLDEFFMKRVGGLQRQRLGNLTERSLDGQTVEEQLTAVHARIRPMLAEQIDLWFNDLHPALKKENVRIKRYADLTPEQQTFADDFFVKQVFPILTPLAVDPGHPFPFISNLSKSMGVMIEQPARRDGHPGTRSFVRIKVPENLPRWVLLPNEPDTTGHTFVSLESVIGANLKLLFPGLTVLEHHLFRVTRNADVETDEEDADDLLAMITHELKLRRMADVVRLELPEAMSKEMRQLIIDGLEVKPDDVYILQGPIDMDDLMQLSNIDRPDLKFKPWSPLVPRRLRDEDTDIFAVIKQGDLLVHHPYESFKASVEKFIEAAAVDPKVLAIKMTLYRTSPDSAFIPALVHAAESGKQVAVLVELKARFDEHRNVQLARRLEDSGVHVVYGIVGLKTHTKLATVVREEPDGLRTYCHIGTGNYNPRTANLYTDLGLFTCNPFITQDTIELFHYLTGRSLKKEYQKLLVAPVNMRDRFIGMIDREIDHAKAGRPARIIAKMNALQDRKIILKLYEASRAGVKIDLIVRGFCCLIPGVPGLSENIRIISILGRFLEHHRIYYFHDGGLEEFYIGSADWMSRNLDYRVEAITPIEEPALRTTLKTILDTCLNDFGHAWELQQDGKWIRRTPPTGQPVVDTQVALMAMIGNGKK